MTLAVQHSLLGLGQAPGLGDLRSVRRTELSGGAWVDLVPGWVSGADEVLDTTLKEVPWRAQERPMYERLVAVPRLLAWYGRDDPLPHAILSAARDALSDHYADELGEPFVSAGMCLYRDGRDSVAWHGDTKGRGATADTMVAIVSFGADRPLLLRPRGGGEVRRIPAGHGDLLVMGGSCQRSWEHAVAKTARPVGPRVSVQFRPSGVA